MSESTVRWHLAENNFKVYITARKPLLCPFNKKKKLERTKTHKHWTAGDWERVLFTDESKLQILEINAVNLYAVYPFNT